ncbi:MAG: alpha/beta fold hydrolase [Gammaproteobacteria bacterium]|nr:alpha/beta fold hydrolase [Gammaproteobacteria bacterium]
MVLVAAAVFSTVPAASENGPAVSAEERTVVLLHGLGRTPRSMTRMAGALERAGYRVENIGYPSTDREFQELLAIVSDRLATCCLREGIRIDFVTHSLGGIILRAFAETNGTSNIGRAVMLSPPNQGTELVDELRHLFLFQWIAGPTGRQLGTEPSSVPNRLGPVRFELGVITGDSSFNPLYSSLIPGPDDGKVPVARAKVEGMADFLVLPHTHSFIMNSDEVIRQTLYFLDNGRFDHGS